MRFPHYIDPYNGYDDRSKNDKVAADPSYASHKNIINQPTRRTHQIHYPYYPRIVDAERYRGDHLCHDSEHTYPSVPRDQSENHEHHAEYYLKHKRASLLFYPIPIYSVRSAAYEIEDHACITSQQKILQTAEKRVADLADHYSVVGLLLHADSNNYRSYKTQGLNKYLVLKNVHLSCLSFIFVV